MTPARRGPGCVDIIQCSSTNVEVECIYASHEELDIVILFENQITRHLHERAWQPYVSQPGQQ